MSKNKPSRYISTKFLGLKMNVSPDTIQIHEKSGNKMHVPGKAFHFKDGYLTLTDPEDIKIMDEWLSGESGRKVPPGVKKLNLDAIKTKLEADESEDVEAMNKVEAKAKKGKGSQGPASIS